MNSITARYQTHKSGRKSLYIEACWKVGQRMHHRSYSIGKHGWLGAVTKAITERETSQGISLGLNARAIVAALSKGVLHG